MPGTTRSAVGAIMTASITRFSPACAAVRAIPKDCRTTRFRKGCCCGPRSRMTRSSAGEASTYGPKANFKISLRELPDHGRFRVTVNGGEIQDGLLLDRGAPAQTSERRGRCRLPRSGFAPNRDDQDARHLSDRRLLSRRSAAAKSRDLSLFLGDRAVRGNWRQPAFLVLRLERRSAFRAGHQRPRDWNASS